MPTANMNRRVSTGSEMRRPLAAKVRLREWGLSVLCGQRLAVIVALEATERRRGDTGKLTAGTQSLRGEQLAAITLCEPLRPLR